MVPFVVMLLHLLMGTYSGTTQNRQWGMSRTFRANERPTKQQTRTSTEEVVALALQYGCARYLEVNCE